MPNRFLKESICLSENLNLVGAEAERLFYRLIVKVDDFGRMQANPKIVRAECFPLKIDDLTDSQIAQWLGELSDKNLLDLYIVDSTWYLQLKTFNKHNKARATKSKCPDIPSSASKCKQLLANVSVFVFVSDIRIRDAHSYADARNCSQTTAAATAEDKELGRRVTLYENEIHMLTPGIRQNIIETLSKHTGPEFDYAVREAVNANARNWRYINSVLENPNKGRGGNDGRKTRQEQLQTPGREILQPREL